MSLYNGPPRGGARGGKDQFNWEEVKSDKFREYYLGASVKANVGRWQKDRDVFWYTREKGDQGSAIEDEVAAVKAREEDMMLEALGMKPKRRKPVELKARLDANEMKSLLQRGGPEDDQEGDAAKPVVEEDEDAIRGIGFASAAMRAAPSALGDSTERMEGTGVVPAGGGLPPPPPPPPGDYREPRPSAAGGAPESETLRSLEKLKRKAEKRAKKEAKKAKKKKSKDKKKHKESRKSRHDSSDDESDSGADETGTRRAQGGRDTERMIGVAPGLGHHSRRQEEEQEQDRNRHQHRRHEQEEDRHHHHHRRPEQEDRNRHQHRRPEQEEDRNRHQHRRPEEEDRNRYQHRRPEENDRNVPPLSERRGHRSRSRSPYRGRR